jgi:hypothetical protein
MTADELRMIKRCLKKAVFRKRVVDIISHFHWFLLENVIFSHEHLSVKKSQLDIIKIRKGWEGDIHFTVPFKVRNFYIQEMKFHMKRNHYKKYREYQVKVEEDMLEYKKRTSSVNALLGRTSAEYRVPDYIECKTKIYFRCS